MIARLGAGAVASLATVAPTVATTPSHVVLPFRCQVAQDRIVLLPGTERMYPVIGAYKSHAYTTCAPGRPDRCRTWTLHRFDLACGGWRVRWLDVVAAKVDRRVGRRDGDRLVLQLEPTWQSIRDGVTAPKVAFPVEFAPAVGFAVRFVGAGSPTVVMDRGARPERIDRAVVPVSMPGPMSGPTSGPMSGPMPTSDGPGAPEQVSGRQTDITTALAMDGWVTTIVPAVVGWSGPSVWRVVGAAGLVGVVWAAFVVVRRRVDETAAEAAAMRPGDDIAATCAGLIAQAVDLHRAARDALPAVPRASVREVLAGDLARVQGVLLSPDLTAAIADGGWERVQPVVTAALADLERIGRIIAGVLETAWPEQTPPVPKSGAPVTITEAYELLGVNPQADGKLAKKVVDALRQSWHPDHAMDARDRERREARLKQINAAWDMIRQSGLPAGERSAA